MVERVGLRNVGIYKNKETEHRYRNISCCIKTMKMFFIAVAFTESFSTKHKKCHFSRH